MNKVKIRFITLISLVVLFAITFGFAIGTAIPTRASAATEYSPTSIFSEGTDSDVKAYKTSADEEAPAYTAFVMRDGGKVYYRRNLALKWYERVSADTENSAVANPAAVQYFSMTFAFPEIGFTSFTLDFESAEENVSKDAKATNSVIFKYENEVLTVAVKDASMQSLEGDELDLTETSIGDVTADMTLAIVETEDCRIGEFAVTLNGEPIGKFTNVGGNYLEYRSGASTTPNTPITFTSALAEGAEDQKVLFKELNGQTLEVTGGTASTDDSEGLVEVTGGKVVDNKAPALVINEQLYAFVLGKKYSLTYAAIDVCSDSVTVTRRYYMLKTDDEGKYITADETSASDYSLLTTSTWFMPSADSKEEEIYVSIRFELDDGRTISSDEYVYLTWYTVEKDVATLGEEGALWDYIRVNRDREGPQYVGLTATETENGGQNVADDTLAAAVEAYQEAVTKAAANTSAGTGSYIYLPSLRGLITSNYADYRNLSFSIYYYKQTQEAGATASSKTSLSYNNLKLEVDEEGEYRFRVLVTDALGNSVKLYQDGVLVDVTSTNLWDIDGIPEFRFNIKYNGATIEDAGEQSLGYRETVYNFSSFDVIALSGYLKEYTLYHLDEDKLPEGTTVAAYSELVQNAEKYVTGDYKDALEEIAVYDDSIDEDDDEWDESYNAYAWDPDSSLSFNPQKSGYYILELLVTDPNRSNETTIAYQVIEVRNPLDVTPGQSQWLKNNVTSIVLFSVCAVLAIVIVVLFVVQPSEGKVEDVDLDKLKGKKKKKEN